MVSSKGFILNVHTFFVLVESQRPADHMLSEPFHHNCTKTGTASVLLADIIPSMTIKFIAPLFIHRLHFHFKILFSCALALNSFIMVSFSKSMTVSIIGILSASLSCGIGDVSFLSMTAFFNKNCVSAWSSGTGAAGLIGALAYAALTSSISPEQTLLVVTVVPILLALVNCVSAWSSGTGAAGLIGALAYAALTSSISPEQTLLVVTVVPILLALVYLFLLDRPNHPKFRVKCTCFSTNTQSLIRRYSSLKEEEEDDYPTMQSPTDVIIRPEDSEVRSRDISVRSSVLSLVPERHSTSTAVSSVDLHQMHPTFKVKLSIFKDLFGLLVYLSLVYFFEYLINQSLVSVHAVQRAISIDALPTSIYEFTCATFNISVVYGVMVPL
ncbi:hypothetical protein AHF37_05308 [Paragonimus kellicotti]|nr:hypothetical protein AHF37_05308 [Paragonimus kellicotti]